MATDLGFRFSEKNGIVVIRHHGRVATTLRGQKAADFIEEVALQAAAEVSGHELQQLMARLTGNYKHGNERLAKNHPRNRGY